MSNVPKFTIKELLEAGVHFGHKSSRWNPKMAPFIFGEKNNIHIFDLKKTAISLYQTLDFLQSLSKKKPKILFVGTKKHSAKIIKEAALSCDQYFVTHRWLGGMLTNWNTVSKSVKKMKQMEKFLETEEAETIKKKERLMIERKKQKLTNTLEGIQEMKGLPDIMIVFDIINEKTAVLEAKNLGIPVIGIVDSNADYEVIDFPIPGNDDSIKSIKLFARLFAEAINNGIDKEAEIIAEKKIEKIDSDENKNVIKDVETVKTETVVEEKK